MDVVPLLSFTMLKNLATLFQFRSNLQKNASLLFCVLFLYFSEDLRWRAIRKIPTKRSLKLQPNKAASLSLTLQPPSWPQPSNVLSLLRLRHHRLFPLLWHYQPLRLVTQIPPDQCSLRLPRLYLKNPTMNSKIIEQAECQMTVMRWMLLTRVSTQPLQFPFERLAATAKLAIEATLKQVVG